MFFKYNICCAVVFFASLLSSFAFDEVSPKTNSDVLVADPEVRLTISSNAVREANASLTIVATLEATTTEEVTVDLRYSGTATFGVDYTVPTRITIPPNTLSGQVMLTTVSDVLDEINEIIRIDIDNVVNATGIPGNQVNSFIVDDDPLPTVVLSLRDSPFAENGGIATVTATLNEISSKDVKVNLSFLGTALGGDYTISPFTSNITIAAGSLSEEKQIIGTDDMNFEGDETVIINIASVVNGLEDGDQSITAVIADDDNPTIATEPILGSPFCPGEEVLVDYTASNSFLSGNVFVAQLSDATGSFASPVDIGSESTIFRSGTITATIPTGRRGMEFRIRVISSNPVVEGTDNGTDLEIDRTRPVISSCSPTPTDLIADKNCQAILPDYRGDIVASDDCTFSISQNPASGTLVPIGATTIVFTVQDEGGNSSTCSVIQRIVDRSAPSITTCAEVPEALEADASCKAPLPDFTSEVEASDNCGFSVTQSPVAGTLVDLGSTLVTLTAVDDAGNSSECTVQQVVIDMTPPVISSCAITPTDLIADINCEAIMPDLSTGILASDNCNVFIAQDPPIGTVITIGQTVVTFTASDDAGNTSTCAVVQVVVDRESPQILVCAATPEDLEANASCQAIMPDLRSGLSVVDNCSAGLTLSQDPAPGTLLGLGATTVTFTVKDASNNEATCQVIEKVIDTTDPVIDRCIDTAPVLEAEENVCSSPMPDLRADLTVFDNCSFSIAQSPAAGTDVPLGATEVVFTVSDIEGNETTCSVEQVVIDITPPSITKCPDIPPILSADGSCGNIVRDFTAEVVFFDNCIASVTVTQSPTPGTRIPLGNSEITFTVMDGAGLMATCSIIQTVRDDTNPIIDFCPGNPGDLIADNSCQAILPDLRAGISARDNCTSDLIIVQSPAPGSTLTVGRTSVSFSVMDRTGNANTSCAVIQTVVDNSLPEITRCPVPADITADATCAIAIPDLRGALVVNDNCTGVLSIDQSPAPGTILNPGDNEVVFTVSDEGGNNTSCTVTQRVIDTTPPVITACAATPAPIMANEDCQAILPDLRVGLVVSDNCGAVISQQPTPGTLVSLGDIIVTFIATDAAGNTDRCTVIEQVEDKTAPEVRTKNISLSLDASGNASFSPSQIDDGSSDNCLVAGFNATPLSFTCSDLGDNTATLTATDLAGNSGMSTAIVRIVDDTPPVLRTCPSDIQVELPDKNCGITVNFDSPTADDNCSGLTILQTEGPVSGSEFSGGNTTITFEITDIGGNREICSFVVTVEDKDLPVIECPDDIVQTSNPGLCGAVVSYPLPIGTDNCPFAPTAITLISGLPSDEVFPVGSTTVTYRITDVSGNTADCSFMVSIIDDVTPTITCPLSIRTLDPIVNYTPPVGEDNCATEVRLVEGLGPGATFPLGRTIEAYEISDASGRKADCSFSVVVTTSLFPPENITISNDIVEERAEVGSFAAFLTTEDPDGNVDSHTYSLIGGDGGEDNGFFRIEGDELLVNRAFNAEEQRDFSLRIRTTDSEGFTFERVFVIRLIPNVELELDIPNAISPNNDGVNDTWNILNIEFHPESNVRIFTRNGVEVFRSVGYTVQNEWDGFKNGKILPAASYYYVIQLNDRKQRVYNGVVSILR